MAPNYLIAHDMGTSGTKAVMTDFEGRIQFSTHVSYSMHMPEKNVAEQDPNLLWQAFTQSTRDLLSISGVHPRQIAGVGVSTQAFNLLPVDKKGQPLMNMISWADMRSIPLAERISKEIGIEQFYGWTGNAPRAKDVIPRILWLKENRPDIWKRTHLLLNCQEYILYKLTGKFAMDLHSASIFFLLDHQRKSWSREACGALGIPTEMLPPLYPCTENLGGVGTSAASETGLLSGTPVILCPADVGSAQIGAGTAEIGKANLYIGSGGWICVSSRDLVNSPKAPFWALCHVDPDLWIIGAALDTAGSGLAWLVDRFYHEEIRSSSSKGKNVYENVCNMGNEIKPGADGLIYIPWIYGERGHVGIEHYAKGAFIGLSLNHGKGHMARAIMEGVAYQFRWYLEELENIGIKIDNLNVIGGGCTSIVWNQIISDITGRDLNILAWPREAGCVGAAFITAIGLGIYPDLKAVDGLIRFSGTIRPKSPSSYTTPYNEYRNVSDDLMSFYKARHLSASSGVVN